MVDLVEVRNESFLDVTSALRQGTRDVLDQVSAIGVIHDLSEESSGLLVVIVDVRVSAGRTRDWMLMPGVLLVLDGARSGAGLVVLSASAAAVDAHLAVTSIVVAKTGTVRAVDRNLVIVGANTMSVCVWIVQETALEHLVHGWLDAGNEVRGSEGDLLCLGMEVLRIAVQDEFADWSQGVVGMGPDLRHIVDIVLVSLSISEWHNLDLPVPRGSAAIKERFVQVSGREVLVLHGYLGCLLVREVLDALARLEVVLNQESLTLGVDPLECVRRVAVHVSVADGSATVGEQDHDLVLALWRVAPEVEGRVGVLVARLRVALLRVDEVRELDGILDEENRSIVSDHVVVAFFSVELNRETTWITFGVGSTTLACDGREAQEQGSLLADLVEEGCLCES